MELFYTNHVNGDLLILDQEESRHAIKVLRLKQGDRLYATDGSGALFEAAVVSTDIKTATAKILSATYPENRKYRIHIAIAPTKNIDRFEWFLEKATEIGVDEITPFTSRYSERTIIKHERLEKILIAAMKQSNQCYLPKLNPLVSFKELIDRNKDVPEKFIAHCYQDEKAPLFRKAGVQTESLILIGPEGDFTKEEVSQAIDSGFKPVSLGNTRLRTETAGIAAVQTIHFINEVYRKD